MGLVTDRRNFLRMSTAGAALAAAPSRLLAAGRAAYPPDVGSKFYADGRVHPFAGNTIICHLPQQGEHASAFTGFLDIYRDAPQHSFMRKVALLPPSSYHMTVFGGANDKPRLADTWPSDLPMDLPIADCNRQLAERLRSFQLDCALPFRMRVDTDQDAPTPGSALTMTLVPFDGGEQAKLRRLRDRLAERLLIRAKGHHNYAYHVSIGYQVAWFSPEEERALKQTWRNWTEALATHAPLIVLGAPEFCVFQDMFAFDRQFYLS